MLSPAVSDMPDRRLYPECTGPTINLRKTCPDTLSRWSKSCGSPADTDGLARVLYSSGPTATWPCPFQRRQQPSQPGRQQSAHVPGNIGPACQPAPGYRVLFMINSAQPITLPPPQVPLRLYLVGVNSSMRLKATVAAGIPNPTSVLNAIRA